MKQISILTALAVLVAFTACTKEDVLVDDINTQDEVQEGFVRMRFSAQMESDITKAYLSGTSVLWAGDESIAVFDHDAGGAAIKFDAESSGATTSFVGDVPVGTVRFTAVYPYKSTIAYVGGAGSPITTEIPSIQEATLNSFDPSAAIFVATATNTTAAFTFTPAFALFKVNVDVDNVVQVSVSTTSNSLAGSVKVSRGGGLGNGDGTLSKTIVLKKSDNSVLEKGDYYIVTRFLKEGQSFANFTIKYFTSEAKMKSRVSASGIPDDKLVRKAILNLGSLSSIPGDYSTNRYEYYQAGFDVTIAGNTYNKTTDGDATLLSDGGVFKSSTSGVVFVQAGASITNTSEATIESNVIIASNDPSSPATYTGTTGKSIVLKSGSLVLDNMIVDLSAIETGQFMTKKDNEGNFSSLTLQQCDFRNIKRYVYAPNSSYLNNGIETVKINGCRFATPVAVQLFAINDGAITLAGYGLFTFTNNVVYSTSGEPLQTYVFNTSATGVSEATAKQDLVMDNNLFYNVAAGNGIFRTYYVKSAYIRNNVLWAKDSEKNGDYNSNIKLFGLNLKTADASSVFTGSSSANYCFGALGKNSDGSRDLSWSISDAAYRGPLTNVTKLDTNPIASFNTSTGEFELIPAYASYGPQLQPN